MTVEQAPADWLPSGGILVRPMGIADLDQVLAVAASLKDSPHWQRMDYVEALRPDSKLRRIALVAEAQEGGGVVGLLVASMVPPQAELESIAVLASEQRRGAGRKLFFAMVEELRAAGVSEVFLEVRQTNQNALVFYRSLGWIEVGRRPRYYADPEEDAVLMSLKLD